MTPTPTIVIEGRLVGRDHPTYFVADIAANHDGSLGRAKELIHLAARAGANAAKFQHFAAETIVSDVGFAALGPKASHQAGWSKSVFEVYRDASLDPGWTETLRETCRDAKVAFFTSPYSIELVDFIDPFVPAYKIGSGDITWIEIIEHIASKGKPYILATGASSMDEVVRAVSAGLRINPRMALMQCNTNYTAARDNFRHIHLNVLRTFAEMYPDMVLGLSDHTAGHATVLGAVALGARIVEKHFTDDTTRSGPDHAFSMSPESWREMVERTRELEVALGRGVKQVEENERETVVLQRRAVRFIADLAAGTRIARHHVTVLRPCPPTAIPAHDISSVVGRVLRRDVCRGTAVSPADLE